MNSEVVGDSESNSSDQGDDKTFINKLLVEMKSQFNRTECKKQASVVENSYVNEASSDLSTEDSVVINYCTNNIEEENDAVIVASDNVDLVHEDNTNSSLQEIEGKVKDEADETALNTQDETLDEDLEHEKPRIVLTFRKPNKPKANDDTSLGRRSLRHKITAAEDNLDEKVLKRSARRRSKDCSESVLQSAIARKEKSYNESNKPQRLTRQLKPTQKILENIASAALKLEKNKSDIKSRVSEKQKLADMDSDIYSNTDDNESEDTKDIANVQKKHKHKHNHDKHSKHNAKKLKVNDKLDSDSDQSGKSIRKSDSSSSLSDNSKASSKNSKAQTAEEKPHRRSQRISSR